MAITKPPYSAGNLPTAPLPADVRAKIIAWCHLAATEEGLAGWSNSKLPANFDSLPDDQLLGYYREEAAIAGITMPGITLNPFKDASLVNPLSGQDIKSPLASIGQFLGLLTNKNLWLRVGEFSVGIIILGVGVNAVLRPGKSLSSGIMPATKPIRVVHNAVHGAFQ